MNGRNLDCFKEAPYTPLSIKYALSELEKALAIGLRKSSWIPIDEVWETLLLENPRVSRSSVYWTFVKEKINVIPPEKREKAKRFKEYELGYLHIDVTHLPKFKGKPTQLFVAIDRCTRAIAYWVYEKKTAESTEDFINKCLAFFAFKIAHVLTDNGLVFTNRLLVFRTGEKCAKPSKIDVKCGESAIEHRLTAPSTPKTNGIVEWANGTIKTNTFLKTSMETILR